MLFNSYEFVILLLATFVVFHLVPGIARRRGAQTFVLLFSSLVFYGWNNPSVLPLFVLFCGANTLAVSRIYACRKIGDERRAERLCRLSVTADILVLCAFKYAGFIVGTLPFIPAEVVTWVKTIPLPVGISFYTFQGICLVVDAKRGKLNPWRDLSFMDSFFYLAFFPQLIAGPIVKASSFLPQISRKSLSSIRIGRAIRYLIVGYFLKMVVADNLAPVTDVLAKPGFIASQDGVTLLTLLVGYSLRIFSDFCGYSMIAVGLGELFGYRLPDNFNAPYISQSVTEFWKRWNLSLSSWLKEYLYIPLGGNRKGLGHTYFNLFVVMFIGGLWHGADWRYAWWGSLHGSFLVIERVLNQKPFFQFVVGKIPRVMRIAYCFVVVTLLWTTFMLPDIRMVGDFLRHAFDLSGFSPSTYALDPRVFSVFFFGTGALLPHVAALLRERNPVRWRGFIGSRLESFVYAFMLFMVVTNSGRQTEFLYFKF